MNVQHRTLNIERRMILQLDVGRSMFDVHLLFTLCATCLELVEGMRSDLFFPREAMTVFVRASRSGKMSVSVRACPALASPPLVGKRRRMGLWLINFFVLS
jgi:hypothetical protein